MSTTFPEQTRVQDDPDMAALIALAVAYHTAQYGLSFSSESAARDLFIRLRPVNDADMHRWMLAWNTLLAAQQQQQAFLTAAYIQNTLQMFGAQMVEQYDRDLAALANLRRVIESQTYRQAPPSLRADIMDAARRLGAGGGRREDVLLADRAAMLASPVIKVRTALAAGSTLDEAIDAVVPDVEGVTFNANRAAERIAMQHVGWPSFKNGQAMLYRRITTPGACGWCVMVATRLYTAKSGRGTSQWHTGCRCSWQLVTFDNAKAYADTLKRSDGDYFAAARAAGMWTGDAPDSTTDFIRGRRAVTDGSTDGNGAGDAGNTPG